MAKNQRILVVDDHVELAELVKLKLANKGYAVTVVHDGVSAEQTARERKPDLIVLDLSLPGKDGSEVAAALRRDPETQQIPILMLTARAKESDIVAGFAVGADDYMTKPFSPQVLLARVEALLRRASRGELVPDLIKAGPVTIDLTRCLVSVGEGEIDLTRTEFRLLHALVVAKGRALTRAQLMQRAIGPDVLVTDRTIDVHITSLRKKLGPVRDLVQTVRGVGYKLSSAYQPEPG